MFKKLLCIVLLLAFSTSTFANCVCSVSNSNVRFTLFINGVFTEIKTVQRTHRLEWRM